MDYAHNVFYPPPVASPDDGLPASRIADIVSASPLSDDDIQQLVSALLEKMNTNSEWEAVRERVCVCVCVCVLRACVRPRSMSIFTN